MAKRYLAESDRKHKKLNYIKKYLVISNKKIIENLDTIENMLFYKSQIEKQISKKNSKIFESYYHLFEIRENITKTIYETLKCNPRTKINWPKNKKFAVFLSHDVDLIFPSWKYRYYIAGKLITKLRIKKAYNLLTKKYNPYMCFKKIVKLERKYNAKSTFFFLLPDENPTGINYTVEDIKETIYFLDKKGFEVGLHGGFYSYNSIEKIKKEKEKLENILGKKIYGYRNHYLRFEIPTTWRILEKLNFKYDSTFGYNDQIGFRNGLCFPFRPWDINKNKEINIIELPLNIMDGTLFSYMKLDLLSAFENCKKLIDKVKLYGGVLTLNWHNTSFDGIYYEKYEKLLNKILDYSYRNGGWVTNGKEIFNTVKGEI